MKITTKLHLKSFKGFFIYVNVVKVIGETLKNCVETYIGIISVFSRFNFKPEYAPNLLNSAFLIYCLSLKHSGIIS